jgi:hypothetical protein
VADRHAVAVCGLVKDEQYAGIHRQGFGRFLHHQTQRAIQIQRSGNFAAGFVNGSQCFGLLTGQLTTGQLSQTLLPAEAVGETVFYNQPMALFLYIRARNWPVAAGYALFTGMMAIGYFYNVTFVQLGLKDLGERVLGLSPVIVAGQMAVLALLTCLTALGVGFTMQRWGWGTHLLRKLQLALGVVLVQTGLTAVAPHITSSSQFLLWIVICSLALGVGVPATFSLTTDLIPVRDRGYVAAAITAVAYFAAATFPGGWQIEPFSQTMLGIMIPASLDWASSWRWPAAGAALSPAGWRRSPRITNENGLATAVSCVRAMAGKIVAFGALWPSCLASFL